MNNILFTGGSGLLGSEMKKLFPDAIFPDSSELDITEETITYHFITHLKHVDTVIHMAAFTNPPKTEKDPREALAVNIRGTCNIVDACVDTNKRLIYISTDYVFDGKRGNYKEDDPVNPINKYAWSKLGGECAVRLYDNSLIIRLSFGPNDFPYDGAYTDQWTSREPVADIAKKIEALIKNYVVGVIHIGSDRRTVYEYARSISPGKMLNKLSISDLDVGIPEDTSLDTTKYKTMFMGGQFEPTR
jgi:dTDP-4-dehydrorhamnose reductase